MFRIGQGYDSHKLKEGSALRIGGVDIPCPYAFVAHSDGDILAHAIIDAMFGALNLGDIGSNFPDTDPHYKGIDSMELLKIANKKLKNLNYEIINIDSSIILEKPKLRPYINDIKRKLETVLELEEGKISVKAKTAEGLDAAGRSEAAHAQAVILIKKI